MTKVTSTSTGRWRRCSRQRDKQEEENTKDGAKGAHRVKDVLHGDEQQFGTAQFSTLTAQSESGGENRKTSHNGHTGIRDDNNKGVFYKALLFAQVRTVSDGDTHS